MKIAILGFGTVGSALEQLLRDDPEIEVKRIFSRHLPSSEKRASDWKSILEDAETDTVVETLGGVETASSCMLEALAAGKNVVSANKAAVAACFVRLAQAAEQAGVSFRFSAAVGGGIPWLPNLERLKKSSPISRIQGIWNGTCNYILSAMEKGTDFSEVLAQAQALGFAERDPSADIDGADTVRKVLLSANSAFDCVLREEDIPCFGIRHITQEDFTAAAKRGCTIRLMGQAFRTENGISALTAPCLVPLSSAEAAVQENNNRIGCECEKTGAYSFSGPGAGGFPTAANVLRDLQEIASGRAKRFYQNRFEEKQIDNRLFTPRWYVRRGTESRMTEPMTPLRLKKEMGEEPFFAAVLEQC